MFRFKVTILWSCLWLLLMTASVQAALLGRAPATQGGTDYQAYYDDVLHVTWLANANLAVTNTFGVSGVFANGIMNWNTAEALVAAMNAAKYLGVNTWRLPNTTQPDPTCGGQSLFAGYPPQGYLFSCTGSEMGHLHYVDGVSLFTNVQADYYWSGTYFAASPVFNETDAWIFSFGSGSQNTRGENYGFCAFCDGYAWPVAPGDAINLPPPTKLSAVQTGSTGTDIQLTWDYDANPQIDGFKVYRKTPSETWPTNPSPVATIALGLAPYGTIDTPVPDPYATYTYRVTAFSGQLESSPSDEATAFQLEYRTAQCSFDPFGNALCGTEIALAPGQVGGNEIKVVLLPEVAFTLSQVASFFHFDHFNWISYVVHDNTGQMFDLLGNSAPVAYLDPPPSGYGYKIAPGGQIRIMNAPADTLPYYWDEYQLPVFDPRKFVHSIFAGDASSAWFVDIPFDPDLVSGDYLGFATTLVGIPTGASAIPTALANFFWSTTNNGSMTGGIGLRSNLNPPTTPGTGGVFNVQTVRNEDLPTNVRRALIQAGVGGIPTGSKIDRDAPVTAAFPSGQKGTNGWFHGPVNVTLIATDIDGPSDIAFTSYSVDGGSVIGYSAPFTVSADGIHTIQFGGVDKAGNVETPRPTQTFKIDATPPGITVSATPSMLWPPNGNMVNVTVSGAITDATSGVNTSSAGFKVVDQYGIVQPSGSVALGANGTYVFSIALEASRLGTDQNGRTYTITVTGQDNAGNHGSTSTTVVVPHDKGH